MHTQRKFLLKQLEITTSIGTAIFSQDILINSMNLFGYFRPFILGLYISWTSLYNTSSEPTSFLQSRKDVTNLDLSISQPNPSLSQISCQKPESLDKRTTKTPAQGAVTSWLRSSQRMQCGKCARKCMNQADMEYHVQLWHSDCDVHKEDNIMWLKSCSW